MSPSDELPQLRFHTETNPDAEELAVVRGGLERFNEERVGAEGRGSDFKK